MKSNLSIYAFVAYALIVICKEPLSNLRSWKFTLRFSTKGFIILALTVRPIIYFEFLYMVWGRDTTSLFYILISSYSNNFVENILSLLNCLGIFVKSQLFTSVYFWMLNSNPLNYTLIFMPLPHSFDFHSFLQAYLIVLCFISLYFADFVLFTVWGFVLNLCGASKSIGTIFPQTFDHFVSVSHFSNYHNISNI